MTVIGDIQGIITRVGPWFVQNKFAGAIRQATALACDVATTQLAAGLRLSQPLRCDSSALPSLAKDRNITVYPTESVDSQRTRLSQWNQLHKQRGTHQGELRHAAPYFLPSQPVVRIVHQSGDGLSATWHSFGTDVFGEPAQYSVLKMSPSNWDYDGRTSAWSRFWVLIYDTGYPSGNPRWSSEASTYDTAGLAYDGGTSYGGVSSAQAQDIVRLFLTWKSAHSRLAAVILVRPVVNASDAYVEPANAANYTVAPVTDHPAWGNWGTDLTTRPRNCLWLYEDNP
jgi:hypothetical protein